MHKTHASGLWMTISELARERGIDKAAISRRVSRLEAQGLIATQTGERGTKLVNLAEFDRAVGQTEDAVRTLNGTGSGPSAAAGPADPILAKEQARRAAYDADLKQLDLKERLGKLIPTAQVKDAMTTCAETLVRIIEQLPGRADDLAAAVGRDGAPGARVMLKTIARELRESLARAMTVMADREPDGAA